MASHLAQLLLTTDSRSLCGCFQSMKEVVDACLNKDPFERPSAADLLSYKFFKMARDEQFLVEHFLSGLTPPVNVREAAAAAAAEGVGAPELLGGMLRGKSAMGLQVRGNAVGGDGQAGAGVVWHSAMTTRPAWGLYMLFL